MTPTGRRKIGEPGVDDAHRLAVHRRTGRWETRTLLDRTGGQSDPSTQALDTVHLSWHRSR